MSGFVALQTGASIKVGVLSRNLQNGSNVKLCYCGGMLLCLTRQVVAEEAGWALEFCKCWEEMGSRLLAFASASVSSCSA